MIRRLIRAYFIRATGLEMVDGPAAAACLDALAEEES